MYVLGTAGHVDHGKSALVKALTGIDPDRLKEEKERGLTIDLGFAWLTLPSGREVSIVDVPGHERFVRNMLAGVGGIDLALLVVAADEVVMPQTREHLAILDLLELRRGVLVVTKRDLVEEEWLALVCADVEEAVRGTSLEGSPLVACSAVTGQGLDELVATIDRQLEATLPRRDLGRPRLPIDRAFTVAGFGTVVTGTLMDGSLRLGDEVEALPGGPRARVRGLQHHRQKVEVATPGRRTAVNLAGLSPAELERGMVLVRPGSLQTTTSLDVRLRAVSYLTRPLRHNAAVTAHCFAAEVPGRLRLLDRDRLEPGEEGWAQLRLERPLVAVRGDHVVLRSAGETVAGGRIADVDSRRHRRHQPELLSRLERLAQESPEERLLALVEQKQPVRQAELAAALDLLEAESATALQRLVAAGRLVSLGAGGDRWLATPPFLDELRRRVTAALEEYHAEHPLRPAVPREQVRGQLRLGPAFEALVAYLAAQGAVEVAGSGLRLPGHQPWLSPQQEAHVRALLEALRASPYAPAVDGLPEEELLAYLEARGEVVRAGEAVVFGRGAYEEMVRRVVDHLQAHGRITLAQVRDLFGTSRKYAQALLERMDVERITRRVGDERVLRGERERL